MEVEFCGCAYHSKVYEVVWSEGLIEFKQAFDAPVSLNDLCLSTSVACAVSSMVMMSKVQALAQKA